MNGPQSGRRDRPGSVADALYWAERGYYPIPVPHREKGCREDAWQNLRLRDEADLENYFAKSPLNIGVLLGPDGAADIDLDSLEAIAAWPEFAPPTDLVFGRPSKPRSHYFYWLDPPVRSIQFKDPVIQPKDPQDPTGKATKASLVELRCLTSHDSVGYATVVPPSIHESGEPISLARAGRAGKVAGDELARAANLTAAAALLGRYWPAEGMRHDAFLALAGMLAHASFPLADACRLARAIYRILWGPDADFSAAEREVDSTYQHFDDGGETTGGTRLKEMLPLKVLAKATRWLDLPAPRDTPPPEAPAPPPPAPETHEIRVLSMAQVRLNTAPAPGLLIEQMLPEAGLTMFVGSQKGGKTSLATQIASAVALGRPLFDYYRVLRPGPVLFLEQDDPNGELRMRQAQEAGGYPADIPIHFVPKQKVFYLGPALIDWLDKRINEFGLVLIIIDSYSAMRPFRDNGEKDIVKVEHQEMTLLNELGIARKVDIMLLHHESHGGAARDFFARGGGTYGTTAPAESQLYIEHYKDLPMNATERIVRLQGHGLARHEMCLRFVREHLRYDFVLEGAAASLYPFLLDIFTAFGQADFTVKVLCEETHMARATAFRHVQQAFRAGALAKNGANYHLAIKLF
jgi:hypothetical protein